MAILKLKKLILLVCLLLQACSQQPHQLTEEVMIVQEKSADNRLYYTGTIQPAKTSVITSPVFGHSHF